MKRILEGKNKATPKTIKIIFDAIRQGASQRDAAALSGISEDTLSMWKRDTDFSEQMRQKEIECKMGNIKIVQEAGKKTWQAAAWWLERKYPNEFTNRVRIEQPERVRTGYEHLTPEELKEKLEKFKKSHGLISVTEFEKYGYIKKSV